LRPGRFDRMILVPPPDEDARLSILGVHTKDMPLGGSIDLKEIAKETEGYSGADLESICREAGMIALRENMNAKEVKLKHFKDSMEFVKSSLLKEDIKIYKKFMEKAKTNRQEIPKGISYMG